jgi:zinc-ribbon domain
MNNYLFADTFLNLASKGSFFRKIIATVLKVGAVLLVIGGVVAVVEVLRFILRLPTAGVLGGIIFEALFVVAVYLVAHITWIRAGDIARLPESKFNIIPIVALLVKMFGEIYSAAGAVIAVGAGVFVWFAGPQVQYFLQQSMPFFPSSSSTNQSFVAGLLVIAYGLLICFSILVLSYFVSELVLLGAQIERNTYSVLQVVNRYDRANAGAGGGGAGVARLQGRESQPAGGRVQPGPVPPATAPSAATRCPRCGAALEPGSGFCENCGAKLG